MNKLIKRLIPITLWTITICSFATVLSSTLAWFAYMTRVNVVMEGTVVKNTSDLQVGIKTDISTFSSDIIAKYELESATIEGVNYTFSPAGHGLASQIIKQYLQANNHAFDLLQPVTSKRYDDGDTLTLMKAPLAGRPQIDVLAEHNSYVKIPFVFRIYKGNGQYSTNQPIWLSQSECSTDHGDNIINKAVRVHFEGNIYNGNEVTSNKFIFNPTSTEAGYNNLAGVLNLDHDDYYDTFFNGYLGQSEEIIYGDYDGVKPTSELLDEDSELDDINNTGNNEYKTTFTSKHKGGQFCFSSYTGIVPHKANYYGTNNIYPLVSPDTQILSGGKVLTMTDNNGLAELNTTVYIEGWDHAVINQQAGYSFLLGLTFEINREA